MKKTLAIVPLAIVMISNVARCDTFGSGFNTFDIEFVTIGNPGNVPDTTGNPNQVGSVAYTYRMGKFEVSEQMIDKANSLGGLNITYIHPRGPNGPATHVSWNETARFVNWLNTSQGFQAAYKFAIQPGQVGYDANADIQLWMSGDAGYNPNNLYRSSFARYCLPSVDEWYKAAYYDPINGVYYNYPLGTDSVPDGIDFRDDPSFDAVFNDGGSNVQPNDITNVGTLSPYGTAGQGGNVFEWEETDFDMVNGPTSTGVRGTRGGSWSNIGVNLSSSNRFNDDPSNEVFVIGFRVASITEQSPGDFNGDGAIDAADYVVWRKNNGPVSDYNKWRANFGQPAGSGAAVSEYATVPECATIVLLGIVGWALVARRRRRPASARC